MNLITPFILILHVLAVRSLSVCPAPYINISPCICMEDPTGVKPSAIQCSGDEKLDLIEVFEILDANIGPKNKDFKTFYLNNTSIEEIPENVFKDLTFEEIIIEKTDKLSKISQNSFHGLEECVKRFHLKDTKLNLNSNNYSDIQALNSLKSVEFLDFSSSECPPTRLLGPKCKCDLVSDFETQDIISPKSMAIVCSQVMNSEELFQVFDGLNTHLTGNERNFFRFHLKVSNITQLPENVFQGITFSEVMIQDCPHLNQIHKNVFHTIEPFVNRLSVSNIDMKNDSNSSGDLWYAISGLTNLVSLDLVNIFDQIPDRAFKLIGHQGQVRLKMFSHSGHETTASSGHRIKRVGRYAFNYLPNIQIIDLQNNLIESIDKYSFANQISSERPLIIRLGRNKLNQSSFAVGSLAGSQRPIKLELGQLFMGCNRDILYLNEPVFSPFLDKAGNELDIGCAFVMQCDCNMKWLYDGPDFWKVKIKTGSFGDTVIPCELESEDGVEEVSIWDLPEDFFQCDLNQNIVDESENVESALNNSAENEVQELIEDAIELIV